MTKFLLTLAICAAAVFSQGMYRIYTAVYADDGFVKYARPYLELAFFDWQVEQDQDGNPFVYAPPGEFIVLTMENMPFMLFLYWKDEPVPDAVASPVITPMMIFPTPNHNMVARARFVQLFRVLVDGAEWIYPTNTLVTLPTPTREGYDFMGWESLIPIYENTFYMPQGAVAGEIVGEIVSVWSPEGGPIVGPPVTQPQEPPYIPQEPPHLPQEPPPSPQEPPYIPQIPPPAPPDTSPNIPEGDTASDDPSDYHIYDPPPSGNPIPIPPAQQRETTWTHPTRIVRTPQPIAHTPPVLILPSTQSRCPLEFLALRRIIQIPSLDYFAPDRDLSQVVLLGALMNAHNAAGGGIFSIRDYGLTNQWYKEALNWALSLGLMDIEDFVPFRIITIEEMNEILNRYLSLRVSVIDELRLPAKSSEPITRMEFAYIMVQFFDF